MRTRTGLIALPVFLAASLAWSQGGTVELPPFAEVDTDDSGNLNLEELKAVLRSNAPHETLFERWDVDGDGSLSEAEYTGRGAGSE